MAEIVMGKSGWNKKRTIQSIVICVILASSSFGFWQKNNAQAAVIDPKITPLSMHAPSVYLLLNTDPHAVPLRGQKVTFEVTVLNQQNTPLETTLILIIAGPDGYSHYDFQPINVGANGVFDYSFNWEVPNVAGTYVVATGLAPATLTAYDAKWLEVT
jgi:hypothetical protein